MNRGLIIFAREPVPGKVKTRLGKDIGDEAAATVYSAMLEDVLNKISALENIRAFIFWDSDNLVFPAYPALNRLEMFRQCGADLGERMSNAFDIAFADGIDTCCIIGSDSPDLPVDFIMQAFYNLENNKTDIVYGPAEDGGYYLLGMKRLWKRLFDNIPWSSPDVAQNTLDRINELKLHHATLPAWYDIDNIVGLQRLAKGARSSAPLTHDMLQNYFPTIDSPFNTGTL